LWAVLPFVFLLSAIALLPLARWTAPWWESNRHRFLVAIACSLLTLLYYLLWFPDGGVSASVRLLVRAVCDEYVPFIVLLFSLYTISGGIRLEGDLRATPAVNSTFLLTGGLLASLIGTTGAAMLLIRPVLDTNAERRHVQHTVVFFIFVVCNCGGCLLPIGDPPLFLGYLLGVPFLWTLWHLWAPWMFVLVFLVSGYYVLDHFHYSRREKPSDLRRDAARVRRLRLRGLWPNAGLLAGVILCVALLDPTKPFPFTGWHAWPLLREVMQLALVALALTYGSTSVRADNRFNYHAILEVAALFVGIFICMQPALEILHSRGGELGLDTPSKLFWWTGILSSVLDNAPTYVVFFETAAADPRFRGLPFHELVSQPGSLATQARQLLVGISLGAVFMGAMTYIGNGPNFMVRAIAEQSGIRMPSFFAYVLRYSVPILIPLFFLVTMVFLR
jgi:Na+/H+ antiporter NhaD/arsenite permease-like protein